MKTGLVLEGGALRGLFTAGAMDCLIDRDVSFDYIVGVSAGAGNMMNFLSHQRGRTKTIISPGKKYAYYGLKQLIKTGNFLNLDRMVHEFALETFPFDFDTFFKSDVEHELVVANCNTGKAEYLSDWNGDVNYLLDAVKASCSVPLISIPVTIGDYDYMDGSLVDSIPFGRAFDKGCDKVVVIMTKNENMPPTDYKKYKLWINLTYKKNYPNFAKALMERADAYEVQKNTMQRLEAEGKILVIRPQGECISKFENSEEKRDAYYQHGYECMDRMYDKLMEFMER